MKFDKAFALVLASTVVHDVACDIQQKSQVTGTGSHVMRDIRTPLDGNMITALLSSILVVPAALFVRRPRARRRPIVTTVPSDSRAIRTNVIHSFFLKEPS
jgi:hypothetical protein